MSAPFTRRRFLRRLPIAAAAVAFVRPGNVWARRGSVAERPDPAGRCKRPAEPARPITRWQTKHPEPRPGIDASNVLSAEELAAVPEAIPVYNGIREIPHIADGIRCYCGCADYPGYRSLLTCFEEDGMAMDCDICLGQGRLAYRRWKEGQTLDQIRRAIDARYGPGFTGNPDGSARSGMA